MPFLILRTAAQVDNASSSINENRSGSALSKHYSIGRFAFSEVPLLCPLTVGSVLVLPSGNPLLSGHLRLILKSLYACIHLFSSLCRLHPIVLEVMVSGVAIGSVTV